MRYKFNIFYCLFKLLINIAGGIFGVIIGLTFFYPLLIAFPNSFLVVFIELYLVILLAIVFSRLFNLLFLNYINYKPLFYNIRALKIFFGQGTVILAFYIFGLIFFFFFVVTLF